MNIHYTTQFKKDLTKLELLIRILASNQPLNLSHKDHSLTGNWKEQVLILHYSKNRAMTKSPHFHAS